MTSAVLSGRDRFKQHLRKVGSGEHTSKGMSREEAADAMELMLQGSTSYCRLVQVAQAILVAVWPYLAVTIQMGAKQL